MTKVKSESGIDTDKLARGTPGVSGADLFNIVNTAALKAGVEDAEAVTSAHLDYAKDKILMGAERRSTVVGPEDMKNTAYHEAGHAVMALFTKVPHLT